MSRRRSATFAAIAIVVATALWQSTGDRLLADAHRLARAIRAEAQAVSRPPPPLLAHAVAADSDPLYFSRAAWRSPLLLYMIRMRLAETRAPGPPTLGLHLRTLLSAQLVDLSMSHDEILHAYIGWAYFGRGCFGAEAAARGYFATGLSRATEAQLMALAPLPTRPQGLGGNPEGHRTRVVRIPARLVDAGLIGTDEAAHLSALPPAKPRAGLRCAPPES